MGLITALSFGSDAQLRAEAEGDDEEEEEALEEDSGKGIAVRDAAGAVKVDDGVGEVGVCAHVGSDSEGEVFSWLGWARCRGCPWHAQRGGSREVKGAGQVAMGTSVAASSSLAGDSDWAEGEEKRRMG